MHGPPFDNNIEAMIYNLMVGGKALAFETLAVGHDSLVSLAIANNAAWADKVDYCIIVAEADNTVTDSSRIVRFVESPTAAGSLTVSASEVRGKGMPLGDLGVAEIKGIENMQNVRFIGIEAGKTHALRVQYYG